MSREVDRQRASGHALSWCGRTRREFLWEAGGGFVGTALATLLADDGFFGRSAIASTPDAMTDSPLVPKRPHFPAKAKACIVLFMYGGVSQVDTFDPKPELIKHHGKPIPPDVGDPVLKGAIPARSWGHPANSRGMANRGSRFRTFIPAWPSASTTWRSSAACTPTASLMARACFR